MIQIFDIKKAKANKKINTNDKEILEEYIKISNTGNDKIFKQLDTTEAGITKKEGKNRLIRDGKNVVVKDDNKSPFYFLAMSFKDEFIIILLILAIINFFLGDKIGSIIIVIIAFISALIRFFQEYSVYKFNKKLKASIYSTVNVLRDNTSMEIKVEDVVVGDIVKLNAGTIIPADLKIIDCKDLFVNQSVFTGESVLIEKGVDTSIKNEQIFDINNICLMGTSVVSGRGTGVVVNTGFDTYLGKVGNEITIKKEVTNFDKGVKSISNLLIKYMVVVCLVVIVIDGIICCCWNYS